VRRPEVVICGPERPVNMWDDEKEHCGGVNGTCAAEMRTCVVKDNRCSLCGGCMR
jgi:hypothetical protein